MKLNKEQKDVLKVMVKSLPKGLKFDSNAEKEIYAVLYFKHLKNKTRDFTCGYKTIEAECGYTRNTISHYIKSLEEKKYIKHAQGSSGKNSKFELLFVHENNMSNCACKQTDNQNVTTILCIDDCAYANDGQLCTKYKYKDKYKDKDNYYTTNTILNNNSTNTKTTNTTTTIDYSVLEDMIDRIIENKINKITEPMNTMNTNCTATKELVTKLLERLDVLENTVNTLVENNNMLVQRLDKAAVVIKGLMNNKTTVKPVQQMPVQTVQPVKDMKVQTVQKMSVVEYAEKKNDKKKASARLTQLWKVIDDKSASKESKLPAVKELKELVNSDLISEKQKYWSQQRIDNFAEIEKAKDNEELISTKVETILAQHSNMKEALNREDYEYIKANGEEYLKSVQEAEKLKKNKKLSKEAYAKVDSITRSNSIYKEVDDYLKLVASNKLEGTKHTKEEVEEAKKNNEAEKLNTQLAVRKEIDDVFNILLDKLSKDKYKVIESYFKADYENRVSKITLYNQKEHTGLKDMAWNRLLGEINMHNKNCIEQKEAVESNEENTDTNNSCNETDDEVQLPNGTYEENIKDFTERYIEYMKREAKGEPINVDDTKDKYKNECRRLNKYEHAKESVITEYWLVADKEFRQYNISNSKLKRIA